MSSGVGTEAFAWTVIAAVTLACERLSEVVIAIVFLFVQRSRINERDPETQEEKSAREKRDKVEKEIKQIIALCVSVVLALGLCLGLPLGAFGWSKVYVDRILTAVLASAAAPYSHQFIKLFFEFQQTTKMYKEKVLNL